MNEPTIEELTSDLLAWARGERYPDRAELPLWRWQRWMGEYPEAAWGVLESLVAAAPSDPEVMDHAARQMELLLSHEEVKSWQRATALLQRSSLLSDIVGPQVFVPGHYGPRFRDLDELVSVWLIHDEHFANGYRLSELVRSDPERGLLLALEVVHRGPLHGFDSWIVGSPLLDLLRFHGAAVIDRVVEAAKDSVAIRRVIYETRRQNPTPDQPHGIPSAVWERFRKAQGGTTTYNSGMPAGRQTQLDPDAESIITSWFRSTESAWAARKVGDLVRNEPLTGWRAILAFIRHIDDAQALCNCGCGALEDLIRRHPAAVVDLVEEEVVHNDRFRIALSCVWLSLREVPEDLAWRFYLASGKRLSVLDAPGGWSQRR